MTRVSRKAFLQALLSAPCVLLSGCASWFFETVQEEPDRLPAVGVPKDMVVAEVSLIKARDPQLELVDAVWRVADEQVIPIARRRELDANGFRCGRFGGDIPAPLRELLEIHEEQMALAKLEGEAQEGDPTVQGHRMQLRAARKGEILVRPTQPLISVLLSNGGAIHGGTFPGASCAMQIRGFPSAAASAEIELTPYIEFGEPMRNWQSKEGELSMDVAKPKLEFPEMRMTCRLSPGEVMLVGPNSPSKGLGGVFFHEQPTDLAHGLLLLRLALSQADEVFQAPAKSAA
jgi:hypothetical protein